MAKSNFVDNRTATPEGPLSLGQKGAENNDNQNNDSTGSSIATDTDQEDSSEDDDDEGDNFDFELDAEESKDSLDDVDLTTINSQSIYKTLESLRKATLSIPNRLKSILKDSDFVTEHFGMHSEYLNYPLIANERCGSWYIPPTAKGGSAYFKSTDGHYGQWAFSLRRLNLNLLEILGEHGGAVLVDSTRRGKDLPDALRRAVPIWVAVWNHVLFGSEPAVVDITSRNLKQSRGTSSRHWVDCELQSCGLEQHEVRQIQARMKKWVQDLRGLGLDMETLRQKTKKPIRCVWSTHGGDDILPDGWSAQESCARGNDNKENGWNTLVLCSASKRVVGAEMSEDGYIQGAGDDSEGWSCGLTPTLFWRHKERLMAMPEGELPGFIQEIVQAAKHQSTSFHTIQIEPVTNLYLAAMAGPKPAEILGSYDLLISCHGSPDGFPDNGKSTALSCRSGKLGSRDLRDRLGIAKQAAAAALQKNANCRILVTCETGKDLSVGVLLVLLCLFYDDQGQIVLQNRSRNIDKQSIKKRLAWITSLKPDANPSRSTLQAVHSFLIDRPL